MKIVFYIGPSWKPWDGASIRALGEGGSEIAAATMAELLAARGHEVSIYNEPFNEIEFESVNYYHYSKFRNLEADLLIASRTPGAVDDHFNNTFSKKVLWHHDTHEYGSTTPERSAKFDVHFALSNWHKNFLQMYYPFMKNIQLTSNGLNLNLYRKTVERDPFKMIWSSSPNRGLHTLVAMMPKIKRLIPKATLDVYYGFDNWIETVKKNNDERELTEMQLIKGLAESTPGVKLHGRVSPSKLAEAQLGAGVWAYSTAWHETYCITAAEALASGMIPVTSNLAALPETLHGFGKLIDGSNETITYQENFIEAVVSAMINNGEQHRDPMIDYAHNNLSWNKVCDQWCKDLEIK